jgi:hypothetical protein
MRQSTFKFLAVLLLAAPLLVKAQESQPINVVTSSVPFLRISPDARAGGMGEVGIATHPDANSAFWNLAKTPFNKNIGGIGLTYTPWLKRLGLTDVYLATVSGYYKLDEDLQAISGSLRYFSLGDIQFTGGSGEPLGQGRPREFSIDAGYTRKLSEKSALGVALRFINSSLIKGDPNGSGTIYKAGNTVAGDLSYFYTSAGGTESLEGWNFGAALTNLGGKIGYTTDAKQKDFIPANLGIGTAYTKVYDESNRITFGLDVNKLLVPTPPLRNGTIDPADLEAYRAKSVVNSWFSSFNDAPGGFSEELREFQLSAGMEYWYQEQFALRAGYFYEDKTKGNRKYFTLGAGLKYNVFGLNFSYIIPSGSGINQNPLSNTLRFGIIFDFEAEE